MRSKSRLLRCDACTDTPAVVLSRCLRGADAAALVVRAVHGPCTVQLRPSESLYAPVASWSVCVVWGVGCLECVHSRRHGCTWKYEWVPPSSIAAPPAAPAPDAAPSLKLGLSATTPDSKSTPQIFYTERELKSHFLKDPELSVPTMPTMRDAPCRPKRGTTRAIGKQATIGLDSNVNQSGVFGTEGHPRTRMRTLTPVQGRRESNALRASHQSSRTTR